MKLLLVGKKTMIIKIKIMKKIESKNLLVVKSKKGPSKEPIIFKTTKEAFEYFAKLNKPKQR